MGINDAVDRACCGTSTAMYMERQWPHVTMRVQLKELKNPCTAPGHLAAELFLSAATGKFLPAGLIIYIMYVISLSSRHNMAGTSACMLLQELATLLCALRIWGAC